MCHDVRFGCGPTLSTPVDLGTAESHLPLALVQKSRNQVEAGHLLSLLTTIVQLALKNRVGLALAFLGKLLSKGESLHTLQRGIPTKALQVSEMVLYLHVSDLLNSGHLSNTHSLLAIPRHDAHLNRIVLRPARCSAKLGSIHRSARLPNYRLSVQDQTHQGQM